MTICVDALTGVETFCDGGGVDKITSAQTAGDEVVERADCYTTSLRPHGHLHRQRYRSPETTAEIHRKISRTTKEFK